MDLYSNLTQVKFQYKSGLRQCLRPRHRHAAKQTDTGHFRALRLNTTDDFLSPLILQAHRKAESAIPVF